MQNHAKDSFEFLVHDLKHMVNFRCIDTYFEQIGFFICMLNIMDEPSLDFNQSVNSSLEDQYLDSGIQCKDEAQKFRHPKEFFLKLCNFDNQLWRELEYVISDMYCIKLIS